MLEVNKRSGEAVTVLGREAKQKKSAICTALLTYFEHCRCWFLKREGRHAALWFERMARERVDDGEDRPSKVEAVRDLASLEN